MNAPSIFAPARLGALALRNRVLKAATFEGMCPGGAPSAQLAEFHRRIAQGGVAMTTVAYCSVSPDGRTYGHQMHMRPEIVPALRKLTDGVHAEGAAASIQLGHCGYFASRSVIGGRPLGPSVLFNTYGLSFARAMAGADVARVTEDFGRAARLAKEAGFDAVELHYGHGYLLSQFLSPFTNRRTDAWGGPLENRLRFPLAVLRRVREAVGEGFPIVVKMNLQDGFRGGLELSDAVEIARALEREGADLLVPSAGFVSKTPLFMMRGEAPIRDMVAVQDGALRKLGLLAFGRVFVQEYPYAETFLLEDARAVRAAVRAPVALIGGVRSLDGMERAVREGFEFVQIGRALIHDPDFVRKTARGELRESGCVPCNKCIAEMDRGGVRCVRAGEA